MVSAMLLNTSRLSVARVHAAVASVAVADAEIKTGIKKKKKKIIIKERKEIIIKERKIVIRKGSKRAISKDRSVIVFRPVIISVKLRGVEH